MTKKESCYVEILNVRNAIYKMEGRNDKVINVDEYCNTYAFQTYIKKRKLYELEKEFAIANEALIATKNKVAANAWLETEEGRTWKQQKEAKLADLQQQYVTLRNKTKTQLDKYVEFNLGKDFAVIFFCNGSFEIGLVKERKEDGNVEAHFGHTFKVYFGKNFWNKGFRWEMNYGIMGSFDMVKDANRAAYLIGMSRFVEMQQRYPSLRNDMEKYNNKASELESAMAQVRNELKNPRKAA